MSIIVLIPILMLLRRTTKLFPHTLTPLTRCSPTPIIRIRAIPPRSTLPIAILAPRVSRITLSTKRGRSIHPPTASVRTENRMVTRELPSPGSPRNRTLIQTITWAVTFTENDATSGSTPPCLFSQTGRTVTPLLRSRP